MATISGGNEVLKRSIGMVIAMLVFISFSFAGTSSKSITAARTLRPPVIDGILDEIQWQSAGAVLDFTQFDPVEGALPTEVTSIRILYNDNALYVGVICYDSHPELLIHQLTRRDRTSEAERFSVQIDSYHDHQTAFVFSTNINGVQSDGVLSQDGRVYDITWDAVWKVKTESHLDGWSAEFEIPYNALRFSERQSDELEWGINFRRYISRKHETDEWVMVPRSEQLLISRWGHLNGMHSISPPLHLDIAPYVSSTSTFKSGSTDTDQKFLAGMDVKYGITRDFTLDATVNPDFGQVEVDQAVLNLTVFETRYPEKRPFFVEGSQLFAFGTGIDNSSLQLFFSRRIGKRPTGTVAVPELPGAELTENPLVTTILGAAKISGRSRGGLSLGAVTAATDEERAVIQFPSGRSSSIRIEPRGIYNVVRLKQDFEGDSWVGGIATMVSRDNVLPALSGGVDWNVRFGDRRYTADGYIASARSTGSGATSDGTAGRLLVSKVAAEHWFYTTSYDYASRFFNSNDIGFFAQPHDHGGYIQLLYRENFASGLFRRYSTALNPEYRWNWDGVLTHAVLNSELNGDFVNFWFGRFLYTYDHPASDDAERGIIGTYKRPAGHSFQLFVRTDERKAVSASILGVYSFDVKEKQSLFTQFGITLRPAPWMEFTPALFFARVRNEEAWVFPYGSIPSVTGSSTSVFGDRDVDQVDLSLRGIVTFSRNFSFQFFTQVLHARGRYTNYRRLVGSTEFLPHHKPLIDPDFNQITFNANALLRWEYLPGSTIFLVWTQGRFDDSGIYAAGFGKRFGNAFSLPHLDVLLLKVSYWLPF